MYRQETSRKCLNIRDLRLGDRLYIEEELVLFFRLSLLQPLKCKLCPSGIMGNNKSFIVLITDSSGITHGKGVSSFWEDVHLIGYTLP